MNLKKIVYLSFTAAILFSGCSDTTQKEEKKVVTPEKIVTKVPEKQMSVHEKKQNFKDVLVPIATEVYNELELQYQNIKLDIENNRNKEKIEKLKTEYKAKTDEMLLYALKPHPISILLAQAATESAWLTSRFTKEANNIFGVWSFNKKEPRIAASGMRGDKTIYLKKYPNLKEAVKDYYKNLGKNWAYSEFRKQRTLTSNPYVLSDYLTSYSEKKEKYTKLLRSMISYNKFDKYDLKSDIEYTQYIEKKIKIEPEVKRITETNDTNATKIQSVPVKIEVLKKETKVIKDTVSENILNSEDTNETKEIQKLQVEN